MNLRRRNFTSARFQGGFSLVEVSLAMGIAALALVTLLGMIPQGMDTMRDAGERAIIARIHQQVMNEIQLTPFEDEAGAAVLEGKFEGLRIFYDDLGEELGDSSTNPGVEGNTEHIYTARVHILGSAVNSGASKPAPDSVGGASFQGVSLQGAGNPGAPNRHLIPVVIEVAVVAGQGADFKWDIDANRRSIHTYQTMVVRMDKER